MGLDGGAEVLVVEIGEGAELDAKLCGRLSRELAGVSEGLGGGLLGAGLGMECNVFKMSLVEGRSVGFWRQHSRIRSVNSFNEIYYRDKFFRKEIPLDISHQEKSLVSFLAK